MAMASNLRDKEISILNKMLTLSKMMPCVCVCVSLTLRVVDLIVHAVAIPLQVPATAVVLTSMTSGRC